MLDEFNILKVNCYANNRLDCHQSPMNYSRNIPNITKYHSSKRSKEIFRFFFSYDSRPFHRPVSHSFPLHQNKPIKCDEQSLDQIAAPQRHPQKKETWTGDMSIAVVSCACQVKIAVIASGKLTALNSPNWFWAQQQVWVWKWPRESLSHFKRGSGEDAGRKHIKQHESLTKPSYLSDRFVGFLMLLLVYPTRLQITL